MSDTGFTTLMRGMLETAEANRVIMADLLDELSIMRGVPVEMVRLARTIAEHARQLERLGERR